MPQSVPTRLPPTEYVLVVFGSLLILVKVLELLLLPGQSGYEPMTRFRTAAVVMLVVAVAWALDWLTNAVAAIRSDTAEVAG